MSARVAPAAILAVVVLSTCAPNTTIVAGDPPAPATISSTPGPVGEAAGPGGPPAADAASPSDRPTEVNIAAGNLDAADRPAPQGVLPERVRIPAIGVDAVVGDLGLNPDGSIEVPEAFDDTGWWEYSPRPGRVGASAILGHVDSRSGPAVFFRLTDLRPGDEIHVDGEDGRTVTFAVRRIEQHPKAAFPSERVFGATPHPSLRLITCGGVFDSNWGHHLDNVIVFADRV